MTLNAELLGPSLFCAAGACRLALTTAVSRARGSFTEKLGARNGATRWRAGRPVDMVPPPLAALVREHRDHHHVFYPPLGNADHGPMAYLALHGLGASQADIERFAARYRQKLAPLPPAGAVLSVDSWQRALGDGDAYTALVQFFDIKIAYSCRAQGSAYADPDYERVAARYLAPRLSTASGR